MWEDLHKLDLLVTYISLDVYKYIAEKTTYDSAINQLWAVYKTCQRNFQQTHAVYTHTKGGGDYKRIHPGIISISKRM